VLGDTINIYTLYIRRGKWRCILAIANFMHNNKNINDSRYMENVMSAIIAFPWGFSFNNSSAISWRAVFLVEETGENLRPVASH